MILKVANLLGLMLSTAWFTQNPDFEPAILSITLLGTFIAQEVKQKKLAQVPKNNSTNIKKKNLSVKEDDRRKDIIDKFSPALYLPLEKNFCSIHSYQSCDTSIFPHIFLQGDTFDNNPFIKNLGYKFNGKNLITVHSKDNFPSGKEARTFIMAIKPTDRPKKNTPMFFFAYGQRKTHKCNDGINNHDKSFGLFWGEPQPNEEIDKKFKGLGLRVFFYCEHCKKDRISKNCDTKTLYDIDILNKWYILAVTYNGDKIQVYVNSEKVHDEVYDIDTSITPYLNIGGFVHHNKDGAMIVKDLKYTMNGYIREFIMIREHLSSEKIYDISNNIKSLLN